MLGSGEKTVAPTSGLPSRSFCLAVLKIRAGAFCCCACASPGAVEDKNAPQDIARQIVASEEDHVAINVLLGRPPRRKNPPRAGRMILLRPLACVLRESNSLQKSINPPILRGWTGSLTCDSILPVIRSWLLPCPCNSISARRKATAAFA